MATDGITVLLVSVVSNPQKYNSGYRTLNFVPPEPKRIAAKSPNDKNFSQKPEVYRDFFAIAKIHKFNKKFGNLLKNSSNRRKLSKYYYCLAETEFRTL